MKNVIKDLAASSAVPWGTIAEKIDENFEELENSIPGGGSENKDHYSFTDSECRAAFVTYMNEKAKEIKMNDTLFVDPTGRNNKSTAYDMCRCLVHASGYERLQDIWSAPKHKMTFIKEDGTLRYSTITHTLIDESFKGSYNPMGGKGGSLNAGRVMDDGVTLSGYVSNMSCILQSMKNPENYYAITTMGYYDQQATAYSQKIQAVKDVMKIIEDYADVIVDDSSLDEEAYEGKTYRDIFVRNNLAPNINGGIYTKSVNGGYAYSVNSAAVDKPSIEISYELEENFVPPYSFRVDSTKSLNLTNASNADKVGSTYFAAASVKIERYSAGRLGVTLGTSMNVTLDRITNGFEIVSSIDTPKGSTTGVVFYLGSSGSANLTGSINNPVIINLNMFNSAPNEEEMSELYRNYINKLQTIYEQNGTTGGIPMPNADYICAFKLPKYNARSYQNIELSAVYSKNPTTLFYPASMSKMMTAMVALDFTADLNEKVTLTQEDIDAFPTSNWYTKDILLGETLTIKDVLYIMMMPSSNIATEILSRVIGRKILISRTI